MGEIEGGFKWWMRYVVVPIIGGGGIIAIIVAVMEKPKDLGMQQQHGTPASEPAKIEPAITRSNLLAQHQGQQPTNTAPDTPPEDVEFSLADENSKRIDDERVR